MDWWWMVAVARLVYGRTCVRVETQKTRDQGRGDGQWKSETGMGWSHDWCSWRMR